MEGIYRNACQRVRILEAKGGTTGPLSEVMRADDEAEAVKLARDWRKLFISLSGNEVGLSETMPTRTDT